jgi:hypothetical protein
VQWDILGTSAHTAKEQVQGLSRYVLSQLCAIMSIWLSGIETEKVGHVVTRHPCGHCEGTAKFIKYKCDKCEGYGAVIGTALQT